MLIFQHKGYSYEPWDDVESDNRKRFHDVYATSPDGKQKVSSRSMPMSPYVYVTDEIFKMWIDCGQPTKEDMGLSRNARCDDIERYYLKWFDDKIDQEILGVGDEE